MLVVPINLIFFFHEDGDSRTLRNFGYVYRTYTFSFRKAAVFSVNPACLSSIPSFVLF
jgi:hypothetical protein